MKKSYFVLAALVLALASTAHAGILELRGGYGINSANPDAFEDRAKAVSGSDLSSDNFDNINADVFINIPAFPLGVGLRHEWISQDKSSNGNEWDIDAKNVSVLIDWRILDTLVYLGPIVSIGYPSADVDFKSGTTNFSDSIKSGRPSYSVGAEAGVHLGMFIIGAEAGYQSLELKETNSGAAGNVNAKVDLSGMYGKAMVGVSFF